MPSVTQDSPGKAPKTKGDAQAASEPPKVLGIICHPG